MSRAALEGAWREQEGAKGEHIDETGVSGGAKRRHLSQRTVTYWLGFGDAIYIPAVSGGSANSKACIYGMRAIRFERVAGCLVC